MNNDQGYSSLGSERERGGKRCSTGPPTMYSILLHITVHSSIATELEQRAGVRPGGQEFVPPRDQGLGEEGRNLYPLEIRG